MAALEISFCMAAVLLSLGSSGADGLGYNFRVTSFPYPYYYQEGDDVVMTCWYNSTMQFQHWIHPTDGYISVSQGRAILEKQDWIITLRISNAGPDDDGDYFCVCNFGARPVKSKAISANIRLPIIIHTNNTNVTVGVGKDHKFSCNASNVLQLQWFHFPDPDDVWSTVLTNSSDGKVVVTRSNTLLLRDVQFNDDGGYQCLLTNNIMRVAIMHILKVVVFPVATVEVSYLEVMEGQSASLECMVSGNPLPDVTWRDRLGAALQNTGVTITTEVHNSTNMISVLNFTAVYASTTGPYTCSAVNVYGHISKASIYLRLAGTPDPPHNVTLELVNFTNIRVSWIPPQSAVDSYVIMWKEVNGSSATAGYSSLVQASSQGSSVVLTGLGRLTHYSVFLYASNSQGMSLDSETVTIATSATVPSIPRGVVVLDIGPTSAHVEWPPSLHPTDDGGAPLQSVRLTLYLVTEKRFQDTNFTVNIEEEFVIISGLTDKTTYQIKMEFGNAQGFGPGLLSDVFRTPLPGTPGSPIHVVARNVSDTTALLCWVDSSSGMPFLRYQFEVAESGEEKRFIFGKAVSTVTSFPSLSGCSKGVLVSELKSGSCYRFSVTVTNKVGNGQPSQASEEVCTLPRSCVGDDCPTLSCSSSGCVQSGSALPLIPVVIGVVIFSSITVLTTILTCFFLRQKKKMQLKKSGRFVPGSDANKRVSELSERSTTALVPPGRSFSSSTNSCHSTNSSPEVLQEYQEPPGTGTTIVTDSLGTSPFDFSSQTLTNQQVFMQLPNSQHGLCNPDGTSQVQHMLCTVDSVSGMLQLPQSCYVDGILSDKFPIYSIYEDPPSYFNQTVPGLASSAPTHGHAYRRRVDEGELVMTDNPNYEERVVPSTLQQNSSELEHLPQDAVSDMQSELSSSHLQIPTPRFGESYSQAGSFPDQRWENGYRDAGPRGASSESLYQNVHLPQKHIGDGAVNFVNNDAYETTGPPRFVIQGGEKGALRDTVLLKSK